MAVIVEDRNLLFIMVPHTGCTAIGRALIHTLGGSYLPAQPIRDASGTMVLPKKHNTVPQLLEHRSLSRSRLDQLLVAGTTRNPFDWLVSQYLRLLPSRIGDPSGTVTNYGHPQGDPRYEGSPQDFEAWLVERYQKRRPGPLGRFLPPVARRHVDWLEGVEHLLRFERLQETFDQLLRRVGVGDSIQLPVVNETVSRHRKPYREWYTPHARQIAESAFAGYLAKHGYAFE